MNVRNKVALVATSVITAGALVLASPALAHKNTPKSPGKATVKTAVVSPSASPTGTPTAPAFGKHGKGNGKGHHKMKGAKPAPLVQTVTVDVPETGTYQLLVTEVKPVVAPTASPAPTPTATPIAKPKHEHSFIVPVTGTGSQTFTLTLPHAGNYKVDLISVVSSQEITANK